MTNRSLSLDKNSAIPIYHQLKIMLKGKIEQGVWAVDEMISSERELSEELEISRMTVRHAINELVQEGILYRKRGMGTFVSRPKIEQRLSKLSNFTTEMELRGFKPSGKVMSIKKIPASKLVADKLNLKENSTVIELYRLRLADGAPMAIELSFLPYEIASPLLQDSLENKSVYNELRTKCQINILSAYQTIEIAYPNTPQEAELLEIEETTPILLIERITYSDGQKPIEYVLSQYRGDRYKFYLELTV
jgi:GntR family transcriptional regulator